MAITSTFYDTSSGTPASLVTEVKWAKAHPYIGASTYGVAGAGDFKVTAHPTTPNAVNVAAGKAWGYGVIDESNSIVTVTCAAPPVGSSWYSLICIRRNWTPAAGGPTTVTYVQGTAQRVIPDSRNKIPGTLDDQPLALVKWTAGQTQPVEIVDLRCWGGNGGMMAKDDLALTYLKIPGSQIMVNGVQWNCELDINGNPSWTTFVSGRIPLFGASVGALAGPAGSNPQNMINAGQQWLIQAGTNVNYTDNSGYARLTFQKPFPNGLLMVIANDGDDWATGGSATYASAGNVGGGGGVFGQAGYGSQSEWVYAARSQPASATGSGSLVMGRHGMLNKIHRINWIAIGW